MPVSEKKKISNAKWDRENMATLGCRVKKEEAETFKEYAKAQGKTANTVLKEYVYECIGNDEMIGYDSGEKRQEAAGAVQSAGVALSSDTLKSAQQAVERTGETVGEFTARAIETQVKRDIASFNLGVNPAQAEKKKQSERNGA
jgi:hypothetical protein